jgi:hypothetical protein
MDADADLSPAEGCQPRRATPRCGQVLGSLEDPAIRATPLAHAERSRRSLTPSATRAL